METSQKFKIGQWLVDPTNSTIHDQKTIKLDHKVMQLLCFLAENCQSPVSREQILDEVWANQVVADDVLNVAISSLRKSLGDDSKDPQFIKTLPRKGYQIIAEVKPANGKSGITINPMIAVVALILIVPLVWFYLTSTKQPLTDGTNSKQLSSKIAVLPFDFFAADNTQLYIADGLTEAIINRLVQEKDLLVTSRTSVMKFRDNKQPIKSIGQQLNVDWVLEGSVQVDDQRLQITAQLIEVATDKHAWSETYQRNMNDLFAIQTDISAQIARRFRKDSTPLITRNDNISPLAYNHFLRARYYHDRFELDKAETIYNQAIKEEPDYAQAIAGIAQLYFLRAYSGLERTREYVDKAASYTNKAYSLDPEDAHANLNMALTYFYQDRNYENAGKAFETAFKKNNQDMMIQEWYATYLLVTKQFEKAKSLIDHMRRVSPLVYNKTSLYLTLYYGHDFNAALNEVESISPYMNSKYFASSASAWIYLAQKDTQQLVQVAPDLLSSLGIDETTTLEFQKLLNTQGVEKAIQFLLIKNPEAFDEFSTAELLAWSGDSDGALEILKRLEANNDFKVYKIHIEPAF